MIELRIHQSIHEIERAAWNTLLGDGPPFLRWEFLSALEKAGCVTPEVGWGPAHVSLRREGELQAVAPAYIKGNSEGEFVFDYAWAEFCQARLGSEYYPKLIVACPFTPATGSRLLVKAGADERELVRVLVGGLRKFVNDSELSSAHVLFPRERQARLFEEAGMAQRVGVQFHWRNAGYHCFDDFLGRYNSKRRNQIKRERRELSQQGLELVVKTGSDIDPQTVDHSYDFYLSTVKKFFWGRQYLNRAFFEELASTMPDHLLVVLAREKASKRVVAGAFNLLCGQRLFGRYWGAREDQRYLHFNVCYYQGIEECISRGLSVFEPGAGGEHKIARGFEPTLTYSTHFMKHPVLNAAVRDFLERERRAIIEQVDGHRSVLG